jgi:hypothetical protein
MGCQSNGTLARIKNFQQHGKMKNTTLKDVAASEDEEYCPSAQKQVTRLDDGFFFLDEEPNDDFDSESEDGEVEEDELKELRTEAELFRFNSILR